MWEAGGSYIDILKNAFLLFLLEIEIVDQFFLAPIKFVFIIFIKSVVRLFLYFTL